MGSYISTPVQRQMPQDTFNEELVAGLLAKKQSDYDRNLATIEADAGEMTKIMDYLVRSGDKQYVGERLQGVMDNINSQTSLNLSDSGVARKVRASIDFIKDDTIKGMISSTQNFRNYQAQVAQVKKDDPDKYNSMNDWYSSQGIQEWLGSDDTQQTLGAVQYINYRDLYKESEDQMKTLKEFSGSLEVENPILVNGVPTGKSRKVKIKDLTEGELRNYVSSRLDAGAQQQLQINGAALFRNSDIGAVTGVVGDVLKAREYTLNDNITLLTARLKNAGTEEAALINEEIRTQTSHYNVFAREIEGISKLNDDDPRKKAAFETLYAREDLVGGIASNYKFSEYSSTIEGKATDLSRSTASAGAMMSALDSGFISISPDPTEIGDVTAEQIRDVAIGQMSSNLASAERHYMATADTEDLKAYNIYKDKYKGSGISVPEIFANYKMEIDGAEYIEDENGQTRNIQEELSNIQSTNQTVIDESIKFMDEDFDEGYKEIIPERIFNTNVFQNNQFLATDKNGNTDTMLNVLKKDFGINSHEEFKKLPPEEAKTVKAYIKNELYHQAFLDDIVRLKFDAEDTAVRSAGFGMVGTARVPSEAVQGENLFMNLRVKTSKEVMNNLQKGIVRIARTMGVDANFDDVFKTYVDGQETNLSEVTSEDVTLQLNWDIENETGGTIAKVLKDKLEKNGFSYSGNEPGIVGGYHPTYGIKGGAVDISIMADSKIKNIIGMAEASKRNSKNLAESLYSKTMNKLAIDPAYTTADKKYRNISRDLLNRVQSVGVRMQGAVEEFDFNKAYTVRMSPTDNENVIIEQNTTVGSGSKKEADVLVASLRKADFDDVMIKRGLVPPDLVKGQQYKNTMPYTSKPVHFLKNNDKDSATMMGITQMTIQGSIMENNDAFKAGVVEKEKAERYMQNMRGYYDQAGEITPKGQLVKKVLEDETLTVSTKNDRGHSVLQFGLRTDKQDSKGKYETIPIFTKRLGNQADYSQLRSNVMNIPQVYIIGLLKQMMLDGQKAADSEIFRNLELAYSKK